MKLRPEDLALIGGSQEERETAAQEIGDVIRRSVDQVREGIIHSLDKPWRRLMASAWTGDVYPVLEKWSHLGAEDTVSREQVYSLLVNLVGWGIYTPDVTRFSLDLVTETV